LGATVAPTATELPSCPGGIPPARAGAACVPGTLTSGGRDVLLQDADVELEGELRRGAQEGLDDSHALEGVAVRGQPPLRVSHLLLHLHLVALPQVPLAGDGDVGLLLLPRPAVHDQGLHAPAGMRQHHPTHHPAAPSPSPGTPGPPHLVLAGPHSCWAQPNGFGELGRQDEGRGTPGPRRCPVAAPGGSVWGRGTKPTPVRGAAAAARGAAPRAGTLQLCGGLEPLEGVKPLGLCFPPWHKTRGGKRNFLNTSLISPRAEGF